MSYRHTFGYQITTPAGPVNVAAVNVDDTQHAGIAPTTLTAGTTTDFPNVGIDVSQVSSLVMYCSRDVAVTVTGTPVTINLKAGSPLVWKSTDGYFSNPLGVTDVTDISANLAAGDDATFLVDVLYH